MFEGLWKKTKIADVVNQKVCTIKGEVQASSTLNFPLSNTKCVFFSVLEERFGKGARRSGRSLWFPDKMENKSSEFTITDGAAQIHIRENGDRIVVKGAHQEAGLVRGNRRRRYFASLIKPGDIVVIRGLVNVKPDKNERFISAPPNGRLKVKVIRRVP